MNIKNEMESKNIITAITQKIVKIFSLTSLFPDMDEFLKEEYHKGMVKSEVQLGMNFVPSDTDLGFLSDYVNENVNGVTDALGEKLRGELQRGILNKEKVSQLKKRIKGTFKDDKFNNRLKTVLRTEGLRAENLGSYEGALQSGLKLKKYLSIIMDDRTSEICKKENAKYGSKEQAIAMDKDFIVRVKNKTFRALYPPFHPNCRTVIRFVRVKE